MKNLKIFGDSIIKGVTYNGVIICVRNMTSTRCARKALP